MLASSEAQADAFWKIRDPISEAERAEGQTLAHDISVAVADMPRFIVDAAGEGRADISRRESPAALGILAMAISISTSARKSLPARLVRDAKVTAITRFVDDLVTAARGSISAEHGIGQLKRTELARLAPPARIHALRAIKQALDPLGIMNPGKLVP